MVPRTDLVICCKGNVTRHPSHANRPFRNIRLPMMINRAGFVQQYSTDRVLPVRPWPVIALGNYFPSSTKLQNSGEEWRKRASSCC